MPDGFVETEWTCLLTKQASEKIAEAERKDAKLSLKDTKHTTVNATRELLGAQKHGIELVNVCEEVEKMMDAISDKLEPTYNFDEVEVCEVCDEVIHVGDSDGFFKSHDDTRFRHDECHDIVLEFQEAERERVIEEVIDIIETEEDKTGTMLEQYNDGSHSDFYDAVNRMKKEVRNLNE